jgi:hypothetical protein
MLWIYKNHDCPIFSTTSQTPAYKLLDSQGHVFLHLSILLDAKETKPQYLATTTTIDFQGRVINIIN